MKLSDDDWKLIVSRINRNQCLPFLGAAASIGFGTDEGLPTASQLSMSLAEECGYPGPDKWDFFRVAQFFSMSQDQHALLEAIRDNLNKKNIQPSIVHKTIANLPIRCVLTTNFDNLMERAFQDAGKIPKVEIYERQGDVREIGQIEINEPLVYKLHGTFEQLESIVATEDDIVDFISCLLLNEPPLPEAIKLMFESHSILFLGYGLKDWNIRVLMRALRGRKKKTRTPYSVASFAIQRKPEEKWQASEWEKSVLYWQQSEGLRCFDIDALEFCEELKDHYKPSE